VEDRCVTVEPLLDCVAEGHLAACHRKDDMEKLVMEKFGQKKIGGRG
jgi:hypothetical protein